jgi:hypothetical protein
MYSLFDLSPFCYKISLDIGYMLFLFVWVYNFARFQKYLFCLFGLVLFRLNKISNHSIIISGNYFLQYHVFVCLRNFFVLNSFNGQYQMTFKNQKWSSLDWPLWKVRPPIPCSLEHIRLSSCVLLQTLCWICCYIHSFFKFQHCCCICLCILSVSFFIFEVKF